MKNIRPSDQEANIEPPSPLYWTSTKPTVAGWYWWRNLAIYDYAEPYVYKVRDYAGNMSVGNCSIEGSHFEKGQWAGPLIPPSEEK